MDIIGDHLSTLNIVDDTNFDVKRGSQRIDSIPGAAASQDQTARRRRRSPVEDMAEAVVLQYLSQHFPGSEALLAFQKESSLTGVATTIAPAAATTSEGGSNIPDLLDLLRPWIAAAASSHALSSPSTSTFAFPSLPGPSRLPYYVAVSHSALHPSNILLVRSLCLPSRRFNTAPTDGSTPRFEVNYTECLATSGADKRLIFFAADTGDILEAVEPVIRTEQDGHTAPVLDLAQHPLERRELVTAGMDGKVILWDLLTLHEGPLVVLKDHMRFVVRCCWSADGRWLATAGYDKKIHIYERLGQNKSSAVAVSDRDDAMPVDGDEQEEDEGDLELQPLQTQLRLAHTITTRGNPEALAFVATSNTGREHLVYSVRDDCFIHYLSVPSSTDGVDSVGIINWEEQSFNTNEHISDTHVSYSILSIVQHPTLPLLSLLTGSHASISSNSFLILLPPLSSTRARVLHTTLPSSTTYSPRQAWRSDGAGVWLSSEEGRLRLVDLDGRERSAIGVHGALSEMELSGMSVEEKAKRWRMGGANGCIKDV